MFIHEKLCWIHQQLSNGTLLYVNAEDQLAIPVNKAELWDSYEGKGSFGQHIVANDNQDLDITNVTVYGYNPQYKHGMRYPTWDDINLYLPALHTERIFDDFN